MMYHVIIAGGTGSRFWPKSRKDRPKQLLKILGEETMIRQTVDRIKKFSIPDQILIVASELLCHLIAKEIPEIPNENFIVEPCGKNTAPAIGLAAIHVYQRDSDAVMGIYPADHLILGEEEFKNTITQAKEMVREKDILVTMGITPTYPATGYGYIQFETNQSDDSRIYKVKTFAEKPPVESAVLFFESGEFLWNSGMFIWRAEVILLAMKKFMEDLHESLSVIFDSIATPQYKIVLDREWELIQPESIDYGILENAQNVHVIQADFEWNDLGTWRSLYDAQNKDEQKNYLEGDVISLDTRNSMVISPDRLTAVVGLDNIAVINIEDTTLVIPISKAEKVKEIIDILKVQKKDEYL